MSVVCLASIKSARLEESEETWVASANRSFLSSKPPVTSTALAQLSTYLAQLSETSVFPKSPPVGRDRTTAGDDALERSPPLNQLVVYLKAMIKSQGRQIHFLEKCLRDCEDRIRDLEQRDGQRGCSLCQEKTNQVLEQGTQRLEDRLATFEQAQGAQTQLKDDDLWSEDSDIPYQTPPQSVAATENSSKKRKLEDLIDRNGKRLHFSNAVSPPGAYNIQLNKLWEDSTISSPGDILQPILLDQFSRWGERFLAHYKEQVKLGQQVCLNTKRRHNAMKNTTAHSACRDCEKEGLLCIKVFKPGVISVLPLQERSRQGSRDTMGHWVRAARSMGLEILKRVCRNL